MKKLLAYILIGVGLCAGGVIGWYSRITYSNSLPSKLIEIRENDHDFKFINPLLLVDSPRQAPEYNNLKMALDNTVDAAKNSGNATAVSVYFRDVNSGKWTGSHEDDIYAPSSMLKVAVMMGYLKEADTHPNILTKMLPYTAHTDPGQYFKPDHPLSTGTYTARELIESMIVDSDNDALDSLYKEDHMAFVDVLKSLDIPPPATTNDEDFISPKIYSTIFRTLYSSTYLPRVFSEQALQLLSYTTFKDGLVAGVPAGVVVSHKFGEHTTLTDLTVTSRQLHDCGIVYYPGHPYLLCIMTRGMDFQKLESVISGISKLVYSTIVTMNTRT